MHYGLINTLIYGYSVSISLWVCGNISTCLGLLYLVICICIPINGTVHPCNTDGWWTYGIVPVPVRRENKTYSWPCTHKWIMWTHELLFAVNIAAFLSLSMCMCYIFLMSRVLFFLARFLVFIIITDCSWLLGVLVIAPLAACSE